MVKNLWSALEFMLWHSSTDDDDYPQQGSDHQEFIKRNISVSGNPEHWLKNHFFLKKDDSARTRRSSPWFWSWSSSYRMIMIITKIMIFTKIQIIIIASKCIAAWATMTSAESGRKITCSPSQQHPLAREKSGFYVFIDFKFRYRLICITWSCCF